MGGRDSDGHEEDSHGEQRRDARSHLLPGFARHVEHQKGCREQREGTCRSRVKLMEMFKWHKGDGNQRKGVYRLKVVMMEVFKCHKGYNKVTNKIFRVSNQER